MVNEQLESIISLYDGKTVTMTVKEIVDLMSEAYCSGVLDLIGGYESEEFDENFSDEYISEIGKIYALDILETMGDAIADPHNSPPLN